MKLILLKKNLLFVLLSTFIFLGLTACSSGDDYSESQAWVRIDSPTDNSLRISDTQLVTGNAAMRDGTYPEPVYWSTNTGSGMAYSYVMCILGCMSGWEATIPLAIGKNIIVVSMADGQDSVTVTKKAQITGKITLDDIFGASISDYPVTIITPDANSTKFTEISGDYNFHVTEGNYTIIPSNSSPPQSGDCFSFLPLKREIIIPTDFTSNITDQYFIATQTTPCYSIAGKVTTSNSQYGESDIKITLSDQENNELVRYTNTWGSYQFRHLGPGSYTITPGNGYISFAPSFREVNITVSNIYSQDFVKGSYY